MADLGDVVEAAVLRPGDRLILRLGYPVSRMRVDELKAELRELMPDVDVVVLGNADQMVVQPREEIADAEARRG